MPTEGTLIAAVSNLKQGDLVLSVLLDSRRSKTQITEKILTGAVGNNRHGLKLVEYLLDAVKCPFELDGLYSTPFKPSRNIVPVIEEVLKIAAADEEHRLDMKARLLDCSTANDQFMEAVVLTTITNQRWEGDKDLSVKAMLLRTFCSSVNGKEDIWRQQCFLPHQNFLGSTLGEREYISPGIAYGWNY